MRTNLCELEWARLFGSTALPTPCDIWTQTFSSISNLVVLSISSGLSTWQSRVQRTKYTSLVEIWKSSVSLSTVQQISRTNTVFCVLCCVSPGSRYYLRVNKCSDAEHNICVRCYGEGVKRSNIEHNAATIITCLSDHLPDNTAPSVRQSAKYSQSSLAN